MENKEKNIDQLFKDKLHDYQEQPVKDSWQMIESKLDNPTFFKWNLKNPKTWLSIATVVVTASALVYFASRKQELHSAQPVVLKQVKAIEHQDQVVTANDTILAVVKDNKIITTPNRIPVVIETEEELKTIKLPDGSLATMNQNSQIRYNENFIQNRVVDVVGEVSFEIKSDAQHPFRVHSKYAVVELKGSSCVVRSYYKEEKDEFYSVKGGLSVSSRTEAFGTTMISEGEKITVDNTKLRQEGIKNSNYKAWQTGMIVFDNTPLEEVFETLERQYHISISTSTPDILTCRYTGVFEQSTIHEIIQVLSLSFNLQTREGKDRYQLSGKGC